MTTWLAEQALRTTGLAQVYAVLDPRVIEIGPAREEPGGDVIAVWDPDRRIGYDPEPRTRSPLDRIADYFVVSERSQRVLLAIEANEGAVPLMTVYPSLGIVYGVVTAEGLRGLRDDTDVLGVGGAVPFSLVAPLEEGQDAPPGWAMWTLGIHELHRKGLRGQGQLIGHLDTGVDAAHPALEGGVDAFLDTDPQGWARPDATPYDDIGHGTHTAGTLVGRSIDDVSIGVAPEARLSSAKVIEGGEITARILAGFDWMQSRGVRIINVSVGVRGFVDDFEPAMARIRGLGMLAVFAAGNEGPGTSRSPGNYTNALAVGAFDDRLCVSDFSSSQEFERDEDPVVPDVVGPGRGIVSARRGGGYRTWSGTSMAAPHIAGMAALLAEAVPAATADGIASAIIRSCALPTTMSTRRANRGIPDAARALKLLEISPNGR